MKTGIAVLLAICGIGLTISACTYKATQKQKEDNPKNILSVSAEDTNIKYNYTIKENIDPQNFQDTILEYYNLSESQNINTNKTIELENAKVIIYTEFRNQNVIIEQEINKINIYINKATYDLLGKNYTTTDITISYKDIIYTGQILFQAYKSINNTDNTESITTNYATDYTSKIESTTIISNYIIDNFFTQTQEPIMPNEETISNLESTITQQQGQIANLNTQLTNLTLQNNNTTTQLNNANATIQNQQQTIQNLQNALDLGGNAGIIDLRGMMLDILAMPWAFISQAFNVTLWENTPYEINFSNIFMGFIAIMTLLFIVKLFTNGFNALGTITNSASETKLNNAKAKESMSKARLNDRTDPNNKTTTTKNVSNIHTYKEK